MALSPISNFVVRAKSKINGACDWVGLPGISTEVGNTLVADSTGNLYVPAVDPPASTTNVDNGDNTGTITDPDNDTTCYPQCPTATTPRTPADCDAGFMEFDLTTQLPTGDVRSFREYGSKIYPLDLGVGNFAVANTWSKPVGGAEIPLQVFNLDVSAFIPAGVDESCLTHVKVYGYASTSHELASNEAYQYSLAYLEYQGAKVSSFTGSDSNTVNPGGNQYNSDRDNNDGPAIWVPIQNGSIDVRVMLLNDPDNFKSPADALARLYVVAFASM